MKNRRLVKILILALSLALLIGSAVAVAASANETTKPEIISKNIMYGGDFSIMIAVDTDSVAEGTVTVKLYTEYPADGVEAHRTYTASAPTNIEIDGVETSAYVVTTQGIAAKDMADYYYFKAVDSTGAESAVLRYSVAEYMLERLYGPQTITANQESLYKNTLVFGADAQKVLINDKTEDTSDDEVLVTDYSYVTVTDGALSDGYTRGAYINGTNLTLTYTGVENIVNWNLVGADGDVVAVVNNGSEFTVSEHVTCVPNTTYRGTGIYVNDAYNYSDTTATELGAAGSIGVSGSAALDGDAMSVKVTDVGGDNALTLNNSDSASQGYLYVYTNTPYAAKGYVFETDFKLDSASSTRWTGSQDNEVFQFFPHTGSGSYWGINAYLQFAGGLPYFKCIKTNAEGNALQYPIELDTWYNVRIEIDDITSGSTAVRYYINGALEHTVTMTATASVLEYMQIWMTPSTTGLVHFDNTYFAAITNRGTGEYADSAISYTDTTATDLGTAGTIDTTNTTAALDSTAMGVNVTAKDGDNALGVYSSAWSSIAYLYMNAEAESGTKSYVFETDFNFNSSTLASNTAAFQFLTRPATGGSSFWNGMNVALWVNRDATTSEVTGYQLVVNNKDSSGNRTYIDVNADTWYNIRIEIADTTASSSEVNVYLNNELVATGYTSAAAVDPQIVIVSQSNANGTLYLDNTYFGAMAK